MMDKSMEQLLIDCLEALDNGEAIGEILSPYPAEAIELRPILETAAQLSRLNLQPTVAAQAKSRERFLAQAEATREGMSGPRQQRSFSFWLRPLAAMALLIILAVGFVNTSAKALPGDTLYGAKLFIEGAQLRLTGDGASLEERFRQNRISEIEDLLRQNREANVSFRGVIDEVMNDTWRIEGLLVAVGAADKSGDPQFGDLVEVSGWVGNGRLVANIITVITKGETPATPATTEPPAPTATMEPVATSTAERTTPTQTMTSSPTAAMSMTATSTATATPNPVTATPEPSPDPVPSQEGDDNSGSDSSNSGSGSSNSGSSGNGNSGSGSSNSGSSSNNSGSGSDDDDSGSGGGDDD